MNHWQLRFTLKSLKSGGVIAYPTESVYGLGCDAINLTAIEHLLLIKNRSYKKGLIILVSEIQQAFPLLSPLSSAQINQIKQGSPRATTWLIEKDPGVSQLLSGEYQKLAVRITTNPVARRLCKMLGRPIVSTSCNLNTKPTSTQVSRIRNQMLIKVDKVIAGRCCGQRPSQIIDLESGTIIRQ